MAAGGLKDYDVVISKFTFDYSRLKKCQQYFKSSGNCNINDGNSENYEIW